MKHVVQFAIPKGVPRNEVVYAGLTSIGFAAVVNIATKSPAAIIKDYVIQDGALLFVLDVVDKQLLEYWDNDEEDLVSLKYLFIDPASCNWTLIN